MHPVASGGIGYTGLAAEGKLLLVGAGDGTLNLFDFNQPVHSAPPLATLPGAIRAVSFGAGAGGRALVGTQQGGICW